MPTPVPTVPQVDRLTTSQIAQFKREGSLVLPAVLDPALCRQARVSCATTQWGSRQPCGARDGLAIEGVLHD